MQDATACLAPTDLAQGVGRVVAVEGALFLVETEAELLHASRAASCLLSPEKGDLVLVAAGEAEAARQAWILAVLERAAQGPAKVEHEQGLILRASQGPVTIAGGAGVSLTSPETVRVTSGHLRVNTVSGEITAQELSFWGRVLSAGADSVKFVAQTLDTVAERITSKARNCYRRVENVETSSAGTMFTKVKHVWSLRGNYAQVTAVKDVKIDGEHIHMG